VANDERKKQVIADDLSAARRSGRTYNQMFAEEREKQRKSGQLREDAYKAGRAYELYTPKEVRAAYDADPEYFDKRAKEMKKGGSVKSSVSKRADGIAQRGKTRGKVV